MSKNQNIAKDLLANGSYQKYEIDEIIEVLIAADDLYENEGDSFIDDNEYDIIKFNAQRLSPSHVYFTGVGADIRGDKVQLPNSMPSLEQVQIGDTEKWIVENNLQDEYIVASDKMDGTSLQMIYEANGDLRIAYSRGDGLKGADVTRHIRRMKKAPTKINNTTGKILEVRCEVELSNTLFEDIKTKVFKSDGKPYKNPRNMAAGMMNKKESHQEFYDAVDVFAYEILNTDLDKGDSIDLMKEMGLNVVFYEKYKGSELSDEKLSAIIQWNKENRDYDMDGIVLTVDSASKKKAMDVGISGKSNPKSSRKYKVADASNYVKTKVTGVTYNISKDGYENPQINLEPFDIQGVTVSNTTGFNAGYIRDNMINVGSELLMTRSGDVIPYITKVITRSDDWAKPEEFDDCVWTETEVDLVLKEPMSHPEVRIQRILAFSTSLNLPMLKEGNVRKLFEMGLDTIEEILLADKSQLVSVIGSNGEKIFDGITKKFSEIHFHELCGASQFFGRGIGKRKFEELFNAKDWELNEDGSVNLLQFNMENLCETKGISDKSATKILEGVSEFSEFYNAIAHLVTIAKPMEVAAGGKFEGENVVFTKFRDKDLELKIKELGGEIGSGVSGKTTLVVTADPDANTGKIKKARDKGIKIVGPDELKEMIYN